MAQKGEVAKSPNTGSYIVVMTADPLIVEFGQDGLDVQEGGFENDAISRRAMTRFLSKPVLRVRPGQQLHERGEWLLGDRVTEGSTAMANRDDVLAVYPDELHQPTTDSSPSFLRLDDRAGPWANGFDGEGVVIGVIDSGIWPEHASFADDGSYPDSADHR